MRYVRLFSLMFVLIGAGSAVLRGADNAAPIIESLGHVGLDISDLAPALHFYVDQLGLGEAFRLKRPDGTPWLVYLRVADSNTFIELFPGGKKPTATAAPSSNHLGLFVKDLQATLHALKDRGYPLPADAFEEASKVQADNTLLYFIKDPDGNRIELSQLRSDSLQVTSRKK